MCLERPQPADPSIPSVPSVPSVPSIPSVLCLLQLSGFIWQEYSQIGVFKVLRNTIVCLLSLKLPSNLALQGHTQVASGKNLISGIVVHEMQDAIELVGCDNCYQSQWPLSLAQLFEWPPQLQLFLALLPHPLHPPTMQLPGVVQCCTTLHAECP